jgi:hypothetical protein
MKSPVPGSASVFWRTPMILWVAETALEAGCRPVDAVIASDGSGGTRAPGPGACIGVFRNRSWAPPMLYGAPCRRGEGAVRRCLVFWVTFPC